MSKIDQQLFKAHEHALEKDLEHCPKCGSSMSLKRSKNGTFIGCDQYPKCDYTRPLVTQESIESQVIAGSVCPKCQHELAVKSGRFGLFIGCTQYPDCDHIEKTEQSQGLQVPCPKCSSGILEQRTNRFGKSFYACNTYPSCKYLVNYPPKAQSCPDCHFPLLVERKNATGSRLECPQKQCKYKCAIE